LLREASQEAEAKQEARKQLHTSLALLVVDSSQVEYLYRRLVDAEPHEVPVIRDALALHKEELINRLWSVVDRPAKGKESQRLRAAAALAVYDPESKKWAKMSDLVVNDLVLENNLLLGQWSQVFRPVKNWLLRPLSDIFRDQQPERTAARSLATSILADYAADQPRVLADLVMDADEKQFGVLYPKLKDHGEHGLMLLDTELNKQLPADAKDKDNEKLAKRQVNAAVALLRMERAEKVWPLLKHRPDPRVRSYLIHRLSPLGADPRAIIRRLDEEQEVSIRRALLLSLGEFGPDQLSADDREPLLPKVLQLYRDDPDPGLHGAAEWLLRQWQKDKRLKEMNEKWAKDQPQRKTRLEQIKQDLIKDNAKTKPQWYVNGQGQTMVVIPGPVEFLMGSPSEADREGGSEGKLEQQHKKRISHSFAIAAREVTVEQFLRFRKDHDYYKQYAPTLDCPVNVVTWYDAAAYCNWLSKQEGITEKQWCYLPNDKDEYAEGMKLAPDYLKRTGYRLPSEAEWEYACRAKAVTSRYYGETEELLGKYVWYTKNSLDRGMLPGVPGSLGVQGDCLKPNDFGLFDMLGNALEWCQESIMYYRQGEDGKPSEDSEDKREIKDKLSRVLRGGSFFYLSRYIRCVLRDRNAPTFRNIDVGFRPARTYP